nr:hypothetical protein BCU31_09875 [Vibrio lentus]
MNTEYFWWGLEESEFKGLLYNSMGMYFLGNYGYENYDEFLSHDPHMAYALAINGRFEALEQQFVDLRVIPQMLGVEQLPLMSTVRTINRYDWLKSIIDLALLRFSSIRDIAFHFVVEVLEKEIPDYKLNITNLKREFKSDYPQMVELLKAIDKSGESIRVDRNIRAHKGNVNLFTDDDSMFKNMSWCEGHGEFNNYDLVSVYEEARDKLYEKIVSEVECLLPLIIELVDELYLHYQNKFFEKSQNSSVGLKWSQHFTQP